MDIALITPLPPPCRYYYIKEEEEGGVIIIIILLLLLRRSICHRDILIFLKLFEEGKVCFGRNQIINNIKLQKFKLK